FSTNGTYTEIAWLLRQYELIEQNKTTADDYGLANDEPRQHRARLMLRLLMAKLSDTDRIADGYSFTELVTECTFDGVTCTSSDFTPFLHPEYGVCFTFNGERTISKAGKTEGLRMLMTVNSAHSRLEKPYGNCTEDGFAVAEYYGNYTYTLQSCQHACLQRMASEKCGCVDPLYPKIANQTLCSRYKDATGTQAQRGILLGEQGGGRQGGGSDDSDDYENPVTVNWLSGYIDDAPH
ncbi:hypothetical protein PRIPAC_82432, partial [Pristionchus pacificus]